MFHETDKDTRAKVQAALRNGIRPVLCVGETIGERTAGETKDVIHDQLLGGLANVTSDELSEVIIAYEPVWAIGTGNNALPTDVVEGIVSIRNQLKHLYGAKAANEVQVLYGGSVTADSAADYLALSEVDGLLVGGASLDARSFSAIVEKAYESAKKEA
jgi:triosephosphate isomerase